MRFALLFLSIIASPAFAQVIPPLPDNPPPGPPMNADPEQVAARNALISMWDHLNSLHPWMYDGEGENPPIAAGFLVTVQPKMATYIQLVNNKSIADAGWWVDRWEDGMIEAWNDDYWVLLAAYAEAHRAYTEDRYSDVYGADAEGVFIGSHIHEHDVDLHAELVSPNNPYQAEWLAVAGGQSPEAWWHTVPCPQYFASGGGGSGGPGN